MDRSLDEIIAERPNPSNRGRGRMTSSRPRRSNFPRGDSKKSFRGEPADLDLDWVHDKFEDDRESRPSQRLPRTSRVDRYSSVSDQSATGAKLRVNNLHYDLTERDLEDLFTSIGPIVSLNLVYDRAGRSEGIAFVTYKRLIDAHTAIREFDGANAKGQPIRLSLVPTTSSARPAARNPFDFAEKPKGSLFDRAERPRDRDSRSLSPEGETEGGRNGRRSNVSRPPPEHIDRYVPGQRSPSRRNEGGRGRGRRAGGGGTSRETREGSEKGGRRAAGGRSRKTQEELDQELEEYWGQTNPAPGATTSTNIAEAGNSTNGANGNANQPLPTAGDDEDIDMIE